MMCYYRLSATNVPKREKKSMVMEQYMLKAMFLIRINVIKGTYILDGGKNPKILTD